MPSSDTGCLAADAFPASGVAGSDLTISPRRTAGRPALTNSPHSDSLLRNSARGASGWVTREASNTNGTPVRRRHSLSRSRSAHRPVCLRSGSCSTTQPGPHRTAPPRPATSTSMMPDHLGSAGALIPAEALIGARLWSATPHSGARSVRASWRPPGTRATAVFLDGGGAARATQ